MNLYYFVVQFELFINFVLCCVFILCANINIIQGIYIYYRLERYSNIEINKLNSINTLIESTITTKIKIELTGNR